LIIGMSAKKLLRCAFEKHIQEWSAELQIPRLRSG
jgi:hypothetical protein